MLCRSVRCCLKMYCLLRRELVRTVLSTLSTYLQTLSRSVQEKLAFLWTLDSFLDNSCLTVFCACCTFGNKVQKRWIWEWTLQHFGSRKLWWILLPGPLALLFVKWTRWHLIHAAPATHTSRRLDQPREQVKRVDSSLALSCFDEACWWFPSWLEAPCLKFFQGSSYFHC